MREVREIKEGHVPMKGTEVEENTRKVYESLGEYAKKEGFDFVKYKPVAVGYLDITEEYCKGPVSQDFINRLRQVWDTGVRLMSMGYHECEFCEGGDKATSSSEKVLIDEDNKIEYKFPEMIFHYIEEHGYQPSEDFVLFVMGLNRKA